MRAVVTVVGADKIGIVAGVTATLAELEANIIDKYQIIVYIFGITQTLRM